MQKELQVNDAVARKYMNISVWSTGYTETIDKVSIERVFQYSVMIDPEQYTNVLKDLDAVDMTPYIYPDCIPD